ncbi:calcium-binding protein [Methyloversatilis sp.]|uniref:calcium-binding protein n=1 Tax=Methyloversatilis sp. TaxID=2569862 RepID=UPI0025DAB734|nr:calcium-binding protein [Methyloversatilis sp.]
MSDLYKFVIDNGVVTSVFEVGSNGALKLDRIDRNETWTYDAATHEVTRVEVERGIIETKVFADADGDGFYNRISETYARVGGSPAVTSTGYQFTVVGGVVTEVYEFERGVLRQKDIDANETYSVVDGQVIKTEVEDGRTETTVFVDLDGDGTYAKVSETYGPPGGSLPLTSDDSGGVFGDRYFGTDDDDTYFGDAGNDHLSGGQGNDDLYGGLGNDRLRGEDGDDHLEGLEGNDGLDGGDGDDDLYGGGGNDVIVGGDGDDELYGGDGNDKLAGGDGNDLLEGLDGNDKLDGGDGDDVLFGGNGKDVLFGRDGNDVLYSGAGSDTVHGGNGDDLIVDEGIGKDNYHGGAGIDTVDYSAATQSVSINLGKGKAIGADIGKDVLKSIESAIGGDGDDRLIGSRGANVLEGGAGDDLVAGGAGNDVLIGGIGADDLYGGAGADQFTFTSYEDLGLDDTRDQVFDFSSAALDKIDLSGIDTDSLGAGDQSFTFLTEAPSAGEQTGTVWFSDGYLYISADADIDAEYQIELVGVTTLAETDLVL